MKKSNSCEKRLLTGFSNSIFFNTTLKFSQYILTQKCMFPVINVILSKTYYFDSEKNNKIL